MARHQIEEEDKEIEYLEKKLGLSGSNKKDAKDIRKRLNKELMEDGFGDDIMGFLDQMDHVLDEPDMDVISKELSANEIAALQKQVDGEKTDPKRKKKASNGKMNVKALEKEVDHVPEGMSEDDGIDDMSDGLVDADYLKSFASSNGLKVVDEEGNEEGGNDAEDKSDDEEDGMEDEDLLNGNDDDDNDNEESDHDNEENDISNDESNHSNSDEESNHSNSDEESNHSNSDEENNHSNSDDESNHSNEESNHSEEAGESQDNKEIRYEDITDIYGRVKEGKEAELQQFASKYVPPHLRNKSSSEAEGEGDPLEAAASKQIREVVNKVTDDSFVAMCQVSIVESLHP